MKEITFSQYRKIDLAILTVVTAVFEAIATLASNKWFAAQPIALSISVTMICIAMMRWSALSFVVCAAGGAAFCLASGASARHYLIYIGGNLFALLSLLVIRLFGKEEIKNKIPKLLCFAVSTYLFVQLGRWLFSLFFGAGIGELVAYLTTDVISLLLAVVVLILLRKSDGMIEDQKAYLLRLDEEKRKEAEQPIEKSQYLDY